MNILTDFRVTGASVGARAFSAPWSLWFHENQDCRIYAIRGKGAYLECPSILSEPVHCPDNTIVVVTNGHAHGFRDGPLTPYGDVVDYTAVDLSIPLLAEPPADSDVTVTLMRIPKRVFINFLRISPVVVIPHTAFEMITRVHSLAESMNEEIFSEDNRQIATRMVETILEILAIEITRYWMRYGDGFEPARAPDAVHPEDPYLRRVLEAIRNQPEKDWTLDSMAQEAGLRRSTFCLRFKQAMQVSPMHYLTTLRMSIAAARMREAGKGLAEIAWQVGYRSEAAFNRAFRRAYAMTPGRYRRLYCLTE
jgi:AraC-like DNA-binding protein